ncbi:helix-turn-helix domain-containing protein [Streptacidiphilus sp. PAMC 29251]
MDRDFEGTAAPAGDPGTEVTELLAALSEQAERWQTGLELARSRIRALAERDDRQPCRGHDESTVLNRSQAALMVSELLVPGAHKVSYVRPPAASLLDGKETRAVILANPQISAMELVSRPKRIPRALQGQRRISIRATWTELHEIAIVDDAVAFVPSLRADRSVGISVIQQPYVVRQLSQFFKAAWAQAAGGPEGPAVGVHAGADIKERIIQMLAEGAKDETMARRLGISLRTCRRHVAEILDALGSTSRFQAGVRAAMLGTLPAHSPTSTI